MVVVGHSAGGTVAANMADTWQANALPFARAMFAVEPAVDSVVPFTALDHIPATTTVACLVGNEDTVVGRGDCNTSCGLAPRTLGTWSDGIPVVPATVTFDAKPACPVGSTTIGCVP